MNPFRILITDVDGTLLDDEGGLPAINRSALEACRNAGVTVCLATGRRWTTCRRLLDRLDLWSLTHYAILNNGMVIKDLSNQTELLRQSFTLNVVQQVVDHLAPFALEPIVLGHSSTGETPDVFWSRLTAMNGDFIDKNLSHAKQVGDFSELAAEPMVELLLIGPYAQLAVAQAAVSNLPVETALIKNTFYAEWMLEMTPRSISKLSGAQFLLKRLGLGIDQVLAVGDSANDLPLLQAAGISVAMAHAPQEIKALVHQVAGPNHTGGMGEAVLARLGKRILPT